MDTLTLEWPAAAVSSRRPAAYAAMPAARAADEATVARARAAAHRTMPDADLIELSDAGGRCATFALRSRFAVNGALRVPHAEGEGDPDGARAQAACDREASAAVWLATRHVGPPAQRRPRGTPYYYSLDRGRRLTAAEARGPLAVQGLRLLQAMHGAGDANVPCGPPHALDAGDVRAVIFSRDNTTWTPSYRWQTASLDDALGEALRQVTAAAPRRQPVHGDAAFYSVAALPPWSVRHAPVQLLPSETLRLDDPSIDLAHWALWEDRAPAELPDLLATYDPTGATVGDDLLTRVQLRLCHYLLKRHVLAATRAEGLAASQYAGWRLQQALPLVAPMLRCHAGLAIDGPAVAELTAACLPAEAA